MICRSLNQIDLPALLQLIAFYPELNWSPAMLETSLQLRQNQAFGLFDEANLVCFALLQVVGDEADLLLIATSPPYRKQGHAMALLKRVCAPFEKIFLEVRAGNQAACKLYERCGFQKIGLRKNYYINPVEDGLQYQFRR